MKYLYLLVLALFSCVSSATESNTALGISWAKCSKQSELMAGMTKNSELANTLKNGSAILRAYAIAAAGGDAAEAQRMKTEVAFASEVERNHNNNEALQAFTAKWRAEVEADAAMCSKSFEENKPRFSSTVRDMLKPNAADTKR
ncbi:MAG TPA: hypothetical protein VLC92_19330 [Rhodocyclaceae bacterium]|nr:hypothetical protein [Rhodocyclaceae bacterium]